MLARGKSVSSLKSCSNIELKCRSAEYMLEAIGAGATATSSQDWPLVWTKSPEADQVNQDIEQIHITGRQKPAVQATFISEFATSWLYQTWELTKRNYVAYWRDPMYLIAKLALNIFGGLFIGFTFFKASNSQQGTQNKLFVRFCSILAFDHRLMFGFLSQSSWLQF